MRPRYQTAPEANALAADLEFVSTSVFIGSKSARAMASCSASLGDEVTIDAAESTLLLESTGTTSKQEVWLARIERHRQNRHPTRERVRVSGVQRP
ncbi:hypothetical protein HPB50_015501 [Hyalomma asiaticum]|uniref:Uncharacterized protein n=1 Tax=Hyalomma asiaticum TaxID=266040 RepID=A0ACB7S0J6_HYAAI|nr:hypothetical protein HPB50_015501 [Hyalomma asiaticum]